jgi:hypothetical protein
MLTICAWCESEGRQDTLEALKSAMLGEQISHGICEEHLQEVTRQQRVYSEGLRRYERECA